MDLQCQAKEMFGVLLQASVLNAQKQLNLITIQDNYYSNNSIYYECYVSLGTNSLYNEVW